MSPDSMREFFNNFGYVPDGYFLLVTMGDKLSDSKGEVSHAYYPLKILLDESGDNNRLIEELVSTINENNGKKHVYFAVCPRSYEDQKEAAVSYIPAFWADMDARDSGMTEDECLSNIKNFPLKPSVVVSSGHGYHVYWVLKSPAYINSEQDKVLFRRISRAITDKISGDRTHDLSRLLRLPGTMNIKGLYDPKYPPGSTLTEVTENTGNRYSLDEFMQALGVSPDDLSDGYTDPPDIEFTGQSMSEERLDELSDKVGPGILADSGLSKEELLGNDRSGRDYKVARRLIEAGATDDEIKAFFEAYPHGVGEKHLQDMERNFGNPSYLKVVISAARRGEERSKEYLKKVDPKLVSIISMVKAAVNTNNGIPDAVLDYVNDLEEFNKIGEFGRAKKEIANAAHIKVKDLNSVLANRKKKRRQDKNSWNTKRDSELHNRLAAMDDPKFTLKEKVEELSFVVIEWLTSPDVGFFINTGRYGSSNNIPDDCYYFYRDTKTLYQVGSKSFLAWLEDQGRFYLNASTGLGRVLLTVIENEALRNSVQAKVASAAYFDPETSCLYIDLFNQRILKLDGNTIEAVDNGDNGVFFLTQGTSSPLEYDPSVQVSNAELDAFFTTNFDHESPLTDGQSRDVMESWLYSYFFKSALPTRPILLFTGKPGSGKSTMAIKILKLLLGESADLNPLDFNKSSGSESFDAATTNLPVVCFDNVDTGVVWLRDRLATIATGGQIMKRKLYTDNKMAVSKADAYVMITSMSPKFKREDISQRLLIIKTRPYDEDGTSGYLSEAHIRRQINFSRSRMFSMIVSNLNLIVRDINRKGMDLVFQERVELRMADWAVLARLWMRIKYGEVEGTEYTKSLFQAIKRSQSDFITENDTIVEVLEEWIRADNLQNGVSKFKPMDLFNELKDFAQRSGIVWEINPVVFGKTLTKITDTLKSRGIEIVRNRTGKAGQSLTISVTDEFDYRDLDYGDLEINEEELGAESLNLYRRAKLKMESGWRSGAFGHVSHYELFVMAKANNDLNNGNSVVVDVVANSGNDPNKRYDISSAYTKDTLEIYDKSLQPQ